MGPVRNNSKSRVAKRGGGANSSKGRTEAKRRPLRRRSSTKAERLRSHYRVEEMAFYLVREAHQVAISRGERVSPHELVANAFSLAQYFFVVADTHKALLLATDPRGHDAVLVCPDGHRRVPRTPETTDGQLMARMVVINTSEAKSCGCTGSAEHAGSGSPCPGGIHVLMLASVWLEGRRLRKKDSVEPSVERVEPAGEWLWVDCYNFDDQPPGVSLTSDESRAYRFDDKAVQLQVAEFLMSSRVAPLGEYRRQVDVDKGRVRVKRIVEVH